jgi:phosphoadenosine phosphosulfate reductase
VSLTLENQRTNDELKALALAGAAELNSLQQANPNQPEATAKAVIEWVARNFEVDSIAVACSMADAVLPHIVAQSIANVEVLFLETGYHFADTIATRNEVARALPVRIVDVLPKQTVAQQDAEFGAKLYERDPNLCCQMRKVEPLSHSLKGYELWFTGVRRDEAETRTFTPLVQWDEKNGLVKVNPLAAWTFDQLIDYSAENKVPTNLLLSNGYPSIGCEPCTKPVAQGEDPRSGRWAGANKVECGLHV